MNKYELALVVNAKIEDDVRTATVERAKEYITRAGGTVTEVEEWGKKKLAYERRLLLFHPVRGRIICSGRSRAECSYYGQCTSFLMR